MKWSEHQRIDSLDKENQDIFGKLNNLISDLNLNQEDKRSTQSKDSMQGKRSMTNYEDHATNQESIARLADILFKRQDQDYLRLP